MSKHTTEQAVFKNKTMIVSQISLATHQDVLQNTLTSNEHWNKVLFTGFTQIFVNTKTDNRA